MNWIWWSTEADAEYESEEELMPTYVAVKYCGPAPTEALQVGENTCVTFAIALCEFTLNPVELCVECMKK